MKTIPPRSLLPDELRVIETVLLKAPLETVSTAILEGLKSLTVVGLCECGCRSLYFSAIGRKDRRIADGVGRTIPGKQVEVMVWIDAGTVAALDIVDYECSGELPVSDTIAPIESAN